MNSEMPRVPLDAGQHQMHDVGCQVMLAGRDEDLLPGDGIGAIGIGHGLGLEQAEVGAAMGLGEVHGAAPGAGDHLRQVDALQRLAGMDGDRGNRALGQAGIHGEGHVGGGGEFVDDGRQRIGQALSAIFRIGGKANPSAFGIGIIGSLEALWRGHAAVGVAGATFLIAGEIDGLQGLFAEFRPLVQDCLDHVGGGIGEAGQMGMVLPAKDVVEQKEHILDRGLVARHRVLPARFGDPPTVDPNSSRAQCREI